MRAVYDRDIEFLGSTRHPKDIILPRFLILSHFQLTLKIIGFSGFASLPFCKTGFILSSLGPENILLQNIDPRWLIVAHSLTVPNSEAQGVFTDQVAWLICSSLANAQISICSKLGVSMCQQVFIQGLQKTMANSNLLCHYFASDSLDCHFFQSGYRQ